MMPDNSRILVTGACGSIGSELLKRLLEDGHVVCAFDHNEDGLFKLSQKYSPIYGDNLKLFIGTIRDEDRLKKALENVNVVFHCAALKHVYLSEYNPFETMQTNIIGTNNLINSAIKANVGRVIFTSSDKAVNPSSTMGITKLLGERLVTAANHHLGENNTKFSSVRFGNVLNTNGSVLHIFKSQLASNEPLTITSKEMTRFFITMPQAIDLCLHAANRMIGGEVFVMSMGCFSIINLAKVLCGDQPFEYKVIGQKAGEKEYEELVTETEAQRTVFVDNYYIIIPETFDLMHPKIMNKYKKTFGNNSRLTKSLRSDKNMLTEIEIFDMLKSNGLIDSHTL
jgi:UDP-N-acetylglucosamine 4,6-dehydratase